MLLRRTITPASLAARRANALKSTGPRTEQGKARVALNTLKHGRSAVNLPEKLARAGYHQGAEEWRQIRARIAGTFQRTTAVPQSDGPAGGRRPWPDLKANLDSPEKVCATQREQERSNPGRHPGTTVSVSSFEKKMDWLANTVWCAHQAWERPGTKLETPLQSVDSTTRLTTLLRIGVPPRIRIHHPWARLGLVFYAQRRRGFALQLTPELELVRTRRVPGADPGIETEREPERESALRFRVYRLGPPRFWERIRYCLDQEGNYHPEWQGRYRQCRRELRNSPMAMWLEPHPILTGLRRQEGRGTDVPPANLDDRAGSKDRTGRWRAGWRALRSALLRCILPSRFMGLGRGTGIALPAKPWYPWYDTKG